jgi:amino acid adenylation domain-containing protein
MAPERVALRIGTVSLTYAQLHERARRQAVSIMSVTRGAPRRVGVLADRTETAYVGLLAVLYTGAAVVPLNAAFPPARTAAMLSAAALDAVIVDRRGAVLLSGIEREVGELPVVRGDDDRGAAVREPGPPPADRSAADAPDGGEPAYIMFTSGSTGIPKGVPISHANVGHFLRVADARYRFEPGEVFSQTFDHSFDLSIFDMFMAWGSGGTLVTAPRYVLGRLAEFVHRHGITVWFSVPSAISAAHRHGGLGADSMPSLRWSLFCGEALRGEAARLWSLAAPNSVVENLYGPTELTIACSAYRLPRDLADRPLINGTVPIGRLFDDMRGLLMTADGQPTTHEGELCVAGPQMFAGYLNRADSLDRFIVIDGVRYYRTGDLVRMMPGGQLGYLGRLDQQIKIRGYRVELSAIEWALSRLPGVSEAAVVSPTVGDEREVAAFYTGEPLTDREIRGGLRDELPDYMIPRWVWNVDALDRTGNGKIDRSALTRLAAARATAHG